MINIKIKEVNVNKMPVTFNVKEMSETFHVSEMNEWRKARPFSC
jgi:hypothetical protein